MLTYGAPTGIQDAVLLLTAIAVDPENDDDTRASARAAIDAVETLWLDKGNLGSLTRRALRRIDKGRVADARADLLIAVSEYARPNILR